jgi:predicted phage-related endonuclease
MVIERHPITSREAWLAMRAQDITASVAGALLGAHEFQTAYGLWAEKTGRIPSDPVVTPAMERGLDLEPLALKYLRRERPDWQVTWNGTPGEADGVYLRSPADRLGCTIDAFATCPVHGPGVVQVKSVEPSIFRQKWRDRESGEVQPPLGYAVQTIVEAHLSGAKWACLAVLMVSHGIEIEIVPVPVHAGVIQRVRQAVAEFWTLVESGGTPDPDYARDGALIERLFASDQGTEIDLSGDNMLPVLAEEDERLAAEIKTRAERRKAIKAELLAKMGPHAVALIDGCVFATAKTVHRRAYAVEATSYRNVRFKRSAA